MILKDIRSTAKQSTSKQAIARVASVTLMVILAGCATKGPKSAITTELLSGNWYGQNISGNEQLIWVNQRNEDGTFKLVFKKCSNAKELFYQVKTGTWAHKNNTYSTTTTALSDHKQQWQPATPNRKYVEKYKIHKYANNVLHYGNDKGKFKAYRVDESYTLKCGEMPQGLSI